MLTTPLLAALARRTGPVDVVTTPVAGPLLDKHPAVRQVMLYDKGGAERGLGGLLHLARRLAGREYDAAYLPHRSLRTAALARLARIPRRVGFADGWPAFYTEVHPRARTGSESARLLGLLGPAGDAESPLPHLYPSADDDRAAAGFLAQAGVTGPFVALAPGSRWGTKRWPYYKELATRLGEELPVVVVGGPEDAGLGAGVAEAGGASRERSACGKLTLLQSAALIGRARLLVTNDSAPLHLATALGTPVVALFGPTVPGFGFGPLGAHDVVVEVAGLECRPCSAHGPQTCPLGHHRCMKALPVSRVLAAIEETGALRRRD